jgi:hypothetical protein
MKKLRTTMAMGAAVIATTLAISSPAASAPANAAPSNVATYRIPAVSTFIAYSENNWNGASQSSNGCGWTDIHYHGSYRWLPYGQDGQMYERGVYKRTLHSDRGAEQSTDFGWDRIYIIC